MPCSSTMFAHRWLGFLEWGLKKHNFCSPVLTPCLHIDELARIYVLFLLGDTRYRHISLQALFIELTSLSPSRQNKGKQYIGNAGFKPGPLDLKARSLFVSPWTLGHPKQTFLKIEFQLPVLRQRRLWSFVMLLRSRFSINSVDNRETFR